MGTPRPHTDTPTLWPSASAIVWRARRGSVAATASSDRRVRRRSRRRCRCRTSMPAPSAPALVRWSSAHAGLPIVAVLAPRAPVLTTAVESAPPGRRTARTRAAQGTRSDAGLLDVGAHLGDERVDRRRTSPRRGAARRSGPGRPRRRGRRRSRAGGTRAAGRPGGARRTWAGGRATWPWRAREPSARSNQPA